MDRIARFFIENSKLTLVLMFGLTFFGLQGLSKMNSESFPSVSMATATIVTVYDGATSSEIETKITKPIEDEVRGVNGLKSVRSTSQAGISTIVVQVEMDNPKIDVSDTMDEIQKAVDRVTDLPLDLQDPPEFTELKSEEFPVLEIAVVGGSLNRQRDLISDSIKDDFEDNKAVKEVGLVGYKERAYQIHLDLDLLLKKHVSIEEVTQKIQSRNKNTPGGPLRESSLQQLVRVDGKIETVDDLKKLVIRSNFSGEAVLLGDIADIEDSEEEVTTLARYNGQEATLLVVYKKSGADTIQMVDELGKVLARYKDRYPQYEFNIYLSEGTKVKQRVDVLASNALTGLILVFVFLFIFLPGRIGIAASLSLPLAILGTLGMMPVFGMNIDAITVLALVIALGMMVDNSVVISENYTRLRQEGVDNVKAAVSSIRMLWLPITATALTTIAAFLPMLVTKGVMGQFIKWIPIVVTIALVLSLLESFFFLPMRLTVAGKKVKPQDDKGHSDWFSRFEKKFESFMKQVVKHRYYALLSCTLVIGFSIFMLVVANDFDLFPADQTEVYMARIEMPKGTRLIETQNRLEDISKLVKDEMKDDAVHLVGRAGVSTMGPNDPKAKEGNNVAMLMIYVSEHAKFNIKYTDILKRLNKIQPDYVQSLSFQELINGPPVGNPIEATFRSNSEADINKMISNVISDLKSVPGVQNLQVDDVIGDDEIFVHVDYAQAAKLGIDMDQVGQVIRTAVSGKILSDVHLLNKEVDLILRFKAVDRKNLNDLKSIRVKDPHGNLIPIGNFANFEMRSGTPHIKMFDFKRAKTLTGQVDVTQISAIEANALLQESFNKHVKQIPTVSLRFGGAQESTNESMQSLFEALNLSLIGIFALLVFLFRSYMRPMIIMSTIPLGLFGFSISFYFHQRPASFLALIGIIALGGIIVNSGIVLISFIDEMRAEGKLKLEDILAKASGMRLRAVFVTSLTTISGLLPTAYGIGGNDAILIPMTLAMAWGLTSGTILTLIWVPPAYAILEDVGVFVNRQLNKIRSSK